MWLNLCDTVEQLYDGVQGWGTACLYPKTIEVSELKYFINRQNVDEKINMFMQDLGILCLLQYMYVNGKRFCV